MTAESAAQVSTSGRHILSCGPCTESVRLKRVKSVQAQDVAHRAFAGKPHDAGQL